jgi:6-hydroxycyclohex-1-ene-1-carbonyl-CoA dehydrogenase
MTALRHPETISSWQMTRPAEAAKGEAAGTGWEMVRKDIPLPVLQDGEALVEIAGCGVCGTDIGYFYHGIPTASRPPLVLGHEISGTVVAGDAALLGKEVVVPTIIPCRECELCRSGRANRCLRQRMPGNSYGVYGGFASHIPVPARELCPVPARGTHSLASLAVVADAVATPYQAAQRGEIGAGDRVIVIGVTGGLGIYMAQWAKALGAETVVGVGRSGEKLEKSLRFGVDFTINAAGKSPLDIKKEFFTECRRRRIDPKHGWKIFEMSGSREGQETALELIGYAGMVVIVGYGSEIIPYHLSRLMAFDAEIRGTWGCLPDHYPFILERVLAGEIRTAPFVETRPMSAIAATFEELRQGGSPERRIILTPDF